MRRSGRPILLAVAFGLAGCGAADEPQQEAAPLAPYSGMAVVPPSAADPEELLGLDGDEVAARLGKPTLIRRDGDAEVWQYRRVDCVLDLFLYGGRKQVEHVDLRDRGDAGEAAVQACFQRMLDETLDSI